VKSSVVALALLAPGAAAPPASSVVSPLIVTSPTKPSPVDAKINVVGDAEGLQSSDFTAIWPAGAYSALTTGHVTLSCFVDTHGLAERCRVLDETPDGKKFGQAALELRPTLVLTPAKGPDGAPISAELRIGIDFQPPKKELYGAQGTEAEVSKLKDLQALADLSTPIAGNPLAMRAVTMLDNPVWMATASFDDLARAYPQKGGGLEGYAAAHCEVVRSGPAMGKLRQCQVIKEAPSGRDFGRAALSLAAKFRLAPTALAEAPRSTAPIWVDIPIRFAPPESSGEHTVMSPSWVQAFDVRAAPKLFPPEAVAAGLTTGRGVTRCLVGSDGSLTGCAPEPGDPDGLGFSEAAAKLASTMKMNLWAADGAPVAGGVVHIPIRLNLKGG